MYLFPNKVNLKAFVITATFSLICAPLAAQTIVESAILDVNLDVPWSEPVQIQDPFEGDYLGVFDRNYFYKNFLNRNTRVDVVTLWNRDFVRVLLAYTDYSCLSQTGVNGSILTSTCVLPNNSQNVTKVLIKIDQKIFKLEKNNNNFPISDELAAALKNSPNENVSIRLITENGNIIDSEIGKKTVEAWKSIY